MFAALGHHILALYTDLSLIETNSILFVILLVISVIIVDGVSLFIGRLRKESGFESKTKAVGIDGGKNLPTKNYISEELQLAGRPDAVIEEDGFLIPVEHKPLAKKIHDRYIAQLLVYMRLIEVCEGKKPPYGYLILGDKKKRVRIQNSPERQNWLDSILKEMHAILDGAKAQATPLPRKCTRCDVKDFCNSKVLESTVKKIGRRNNDHFKRSANDS